MPCPPGKAPMFMLKDLRGVFKSVPDFAGSISALFIAYLASSISMEFWPREKHVPRITEGLSIILRWFSLPQRTFLKTVSKLWKMIPELPYPSYRCTFPTYRECAGDRFVLSSHWLEQETNHPQGNVHLGALYTKENSWHWRCWKKPDFPSHQFCFSFPFQQTNAFFLEIFHMLFYLLKMPFLLFLVTCQLHFFQNLIENVHSSSYTPVKPIYLWSLDCLHSLKAH